MSKEKEPATLESLQSAVDELEWQVGELETKVSDLESELKELKESIPKDPQSDIDELFGIVRNIQNQL
ncbi:MAG: hypothetical protein ABIO79_15465 [Ferruginibacter sp.]